MTTPPTPTNHSEINRPKCGTWVLNVDLADFYGHINFGRVRGLFMAEPFCMGDKAASVVAHLCCCRKRLPQGSPTSPVLSNLIAADLDRRLGAIARHYHLKYTRFADDITFSTNEEHFPAAIAHSVGERTEGEAPAVVGAALSKAIRDAGFVVNTEKVVLRGPRARQTVTGLTVNSFPNVRRRFVRRVRAMLHAWEAYGLEAAAREYFDRYADGRSPGDGDSAAGLRFREVIWGSLAYIKQIRGGDDLVYTRLALWAARIDPSPPAFTTLLKEEHQVFDVFISHASEDKETVARPVYEACRAVGVAAFLDDKYIKWGDSLTEKINHALGRSRLVLAVMSAYSLGKTWPALEVNAALAREIAGRQKVLPLVVQPVDLSSVPLIFHKLYVEWEGDASSIAERLQDVLRDDKRGDA